MAEYLSPGVYVEEFDSGSKPMEGVGTSTAGFIGLAERGPVEGLPQLVTNFSDFKRKYGGYLSENEFGEYRFLAYAVEHFFINGGARCFIARVAPEDAKCAAAAVPSEDSAVLTLTAKNPGMWGNNIRSGEQGEDADPRDRSECVRKKICCKERRRIQSGRCCKFF